MSLIKQEWLAIGVQDKLQILIQGTLIIFFLILMEWMVGRLEIQVEQSAEFRATAVVDGLVNSVNMVMLTRQISDPASRRSLLSNLSHTQGIVELRIIRGKGVKGQFGEGLAEEQPVDDIDQEVIGRGKTIFSKMTTITGRPALRVVTPFIAGADIHGNNCLSCHFVQAGSIIGAASVTIDLTADEVQIAEVENWMWIGHIVLQVLILIVITLFVRLVIMRNITLPVRKLLSTMVEIRHNMDLTKRVDVDMTNPDLGDMAKSFNVLIEGFQEVSERLQLFAKIFDNTGEAIFITDQSKNILAVNQAFTEITGYSVAEVTGKKPLVFGSGRHSAEFYDHIWSSLNGTGKWQGEIWNRRKNGEVYPEWLSIAVAKNDKGEVINYFGLFSDITKRKEAERKIEFLAHYDTLTRLPNRALFGDRFKRTLLSDARSNKKSALLFLDLDKFKSVNDTLGHLAGDALLESVANLLKACVRESDTICRHGGDEFLVLLAGINDARDAEIIARKIGEAMAKPHQFGKEIIAVSFSIGISICPDDATDEETMLNHADNAMYRAKEHGRNNYQFFKAPG